MTSNILTVTVPSDPVQVIELLVPGQQGPGGPPSLLSMGTISTLAPGQQATASITGIAPNHVLNLSIPRGAGVNSGGAVGDVLIKSSSTDYDTAWATPTSATTADSIVKRDGNGQITGTRVFSTSALPTTSGELTRKDYVDGQVATRAAAAHTHAIADLTATGTKDSTTFLRGDGTWAIPGSGTVTAANITDATTVGRSVLTAADALAARTAIGAGTSSLVIGTTSTTAKAGDYTPPADGAANVATMRTLGTGAAQAAAGNHTHTAAGISDSTATGRSLITAASAAAARTTIGAGTGNGNVVGTGITAIVKMTQAAYDALATKDAATLYVIEG